MAISEGREISLHGGLEGQGPSVDLPLVLVFDEDAQLVLRAGVADEMASDFTESYVRLADLFLQRVQLAQRHPGTDLHVHQGLWVFPHARGEIRQGGALLPHEPQDLQGAEDAVARRRVIGEDEVT